MSEKQQQIDRAIVAGAAEAAKTIEPTLTAMFDALHPFAMIAKQYDERVWPPDHDNQRVSVTLGECRAALRAITPHRTS